MIEGVGKYVGAKVVSAVLAVAATLLVIWYWRLPLESRDALWSMARGALLWTGFVALLPWALFFVPRMAMRAENNAVSALVLLGYLVVDIGLALYLMGGHVSPGEGRWQVVLLIVGFLLAAIYNFVVCEFLAQRSEESL